MSEFRSVNDADKNLTAGRKPTSRAASLDTTAALAQGEAPNVNVARVVSENAEQEHNAAEAAAQKAREVGERLTGRAEGDADDNAVRKAMHSTEVKLDQAYPSGTGSGATSKISETAQQTAGSAKGALNAASTKATDAANTISSTAGQAATFASTKASEAYNAATSTASNATNTASTRATEAGKAASSNTAQGAQAASETGTGILGSIQSTATAAMNTAGEYIASGRDKVLETVGMGGGAQGPAMGNKSESGIPASSAPLESGKHTVSEPYPLNTPATGVAEVETAPSVRN